MSNNKSHFLPVPRGAGLHEALPAAGRGRLAVRGWLRAWVLRGWAAATAVLARAEQRVTENFRVPPGGG